MALVVAFLGVAVFSSLHKHQGANLCSLNGYDQLMTGETEAGHHIEAASLLDWYEAAGADGETARATLCLIFLRGPPAAA